MGSTSVASGLSIRPFLADATAEDICGASSRPLARDLWLAH